MTLLHHYSVTARSPEGEEEKWFHTFAEADADYQARLESAKEGAADVSSPGYWRTTVTGGGADRELRLDDAGLRPCGPLCGAG